MTYTEINEDRANQIKANKLDFLAYEILNSIGSEFQSSWYNMVDGQKNEIFENLKIILKSEIKD